MSELRRCISCQHWLPTTQFIRRAFGNPYYRSQCNPCRLAAQRGRDKRLRDTRRKRTPDLAGRPA